MNLTKQALSSATDVLHTAGRRIPILRLPLRFSALGRAAEATGQLPISKKVGPNPLAYY
jgi:hypothetical protein